MNVWEKDKGPIMKSAKLSRIKQVKFFLHNTTQKTTQKKNKIKKTFTSTHNGMEEQWRPGYYRKSIIV